ncbi:MAG TPA: ABC transporter substrate-binding protein [Atopostipes sp.]|nr:ABC transporter substrate-binding protein [Atopostipes sp.]
MKKLIQFILAITAVILLLFGVDRYMTRSSSRSTEGTLTIYNWGDYIDPALITAFEEETNLQVTYETFDSNEAMYTKIQQGGTSYDIAIPSEYMIERMIDEDLLHELDHAKIEGMEHLVEDFLDLPFDPGNHYSIPYFWGTLGIIYNDKMIAEDTITSWEDLWNPEYENSLLLIDGAREIVGLTLQNLGYSLNSKNPVELKAAQDKLAMLAPNVKAIVADEIKMYMIQEEAPLAVTFSGEAADMMWENENLHYVLPKEGSNLWFDSMVIPKTAQNIDGAHAFISFMLRPENAALNAEYIGYSSPNQTAIEEYIDEEVVNDEQFYPALEDLDGLEVYENLGLEFIGIFNDLFLEFKML